MALPLSWQMQWVSFASFSLVSTWGGWWRYQFSKDKSSDNQRTLNQKQHQLIGQTTRLDEAVLRGGNCRIRLGDTTWSARCHQDIPAVQWWSSLLLMALLLRLSQKTQINHRSTKTL